MAVILTLTLAGSAMGDGVTVPADPEELADGAAEEAERLQRELQREVGGATGGDPVQDSLCQRDELGVTDPVSLDQECKEEDGPDGGGEPPTNGTQPEPELPGLPAPPSDGIPERAEGLLADAQDEASDLIQIIWKPLQDASKDAGRLIQDVYGAAGDAVKSTTESAGKVLGHATTVASHLADQAIQDAQDTAASLVGTANGLKNTAMGLLPWGLLEDEEAASTDEEGSGSVGTRSASVEAPEPATLALGMIIASGLGLALAGLAVLRRLLGLGGIALLSRIPSSQIMKNGTRNAIYQIVRSDPGVSLNEIVDRVGLSRNAVAYHLAVFESEKLMTSVKDGKYRRYFLNGGRYVNGAKDVVAAIKNDTTLDVIRYIAKNPGTIQKDVCSAVGTSPSATSWHIRRLERVGLVEKRRVANMVQYKPGPNLSRYDLSEFGLDEQHQPVLA